MDRSSGPRHELMHDLVIRQQVETLKREINQLHPADIAYVLENLPLEERRRLWGLVDRRYYGAVLLEVSDVVRETLLKGMDRAEILGITRHMDTDEIADLVPNLPGETVQELFQNLDQAGRAQLESALACPEGTVGALMEFDAAAVREDVTLDVVVRFLRRRGELPSGIDALLVVDRGGLLRGTLPLEALLVNAGDTPVVEVMRRDVVSFHTNDAASDAAQAFDRYDLIAAPVVNVHNQLVGILKVEAVLDYIHGHSQRGLLNQVGLREEEDLFAPIWKSAKNRGFWLALNLLTAFVASRVIDQFSATITQVVALAALMPIVAAVGGNTGNQTLALVIRAYALKQINDSNFRRLLGKETTIGALNGLVWGGSMGLITLLLYQSPAIVGIMLLAMFITLTFASLSGVLTPTILRNFGYDPAYGSAIILTGVTDSLGFFVFLGLAATFLGDSTVG